MGESEELATVLKEDGHIPCCIMSLAATPLPPTRDEIAVLPGGRHALRDFKRTMQFNVVMGSAADAARVKVIQYKRNEIYAYQGPQLLGSNLPKQPEGVNWEWTAGADGWTVDSKDADRCWPEYDAQKAKNGVQRRAIWVSWWDRVGFGRDGIQKEIATGNPLYHPSRFPHVYSVEFKADIICADQDVCGGAGNPNVGNFVIATVFWRFRLGIQRAGNQSVVTVKDAIIDNIRRKPWKKCPTFLGDEDH